jgi:hypothetical protein
LALQQVKHSRGGGGVGFGPLRGPIAFTVGRYAGRKLPWLAHDGLSSAVLGEPLQKNEQSSCELAVLLSRAGGRANSQTRAKLRHNSAEQEAGA